MHVDVEVSYLVFTLPPSSAQQFGQAILKKDQLILHLNNVFGSPACEKKLRLFVQKTCSSVHNVFRQDVHQTLTIIPSFT
jgi:hypothetical protein